MADNVNPWSLCEKSGLLDLAQAWAPRTPPPFSTTGNSQFGAQKKFWSFSKRSENGLTECLFPKCSHFNGVYFNLIYPHYGDPLDGRTE